MRKFALLSAFAMFAMLFTATFAHAVCPPEAGFTCIFYGGDFDINNPNADGLANESDLGDLGSPYGAAVYWIFHHDPGDPPPPLFVTNNLQSYTPTAGYWRFAVASRRAMGAR